MKLTTERLLQFKPGEKVTFKADHPKEMANARSAASYAALTYPERGIRFSVHFNRPKMEVTIEAISTKSKKR